MKNITVQRVIWKAERPGKPGATRLRRLMLLFPVGTMVGLSHDLDETGMVSGYNTSAGGTYPMDRYPLLILFEHGEMECSLDMVTRL